MTGLLVSEAKAESQDNKTHSYVATLDSQKVFDVVHQAILLDKRCHDLPKRTGTERNEPKRTGTDRNGPTKIPKRTSMGTKTDRNGLQWVPKRAETCKSSSHRPPL